MVSISCFYNHYNRFSLNLIFITYDRYIKIICNEKAVIMTKEQLTWNKDMYEFYILSLILTEDDRFITKIEGEKHYVISTKKYWKNLYLTKYYDNIEIPKYIRNPLNSQEPKRHSSFKKIRKFIKFFERQIEIVVSFEQIFNDIITDNMKINMNKYFRDMNKYLNRNRKKMLANINEYERDVLAAVSFRDLYGIDVMNEIVRKL